jgi:hypothetical protein
MISGSRPGHHIIRHSFHTARLFLLGTIVVIWALLSGPLSVVSLIVAHSNTIFPSIIYEREQWYLEVRLVAPTIICHWVLCMMIAGRKMTFWEREFKYLSGDIFSTPFSHLSVLVCRVYSIATNQLQYHYSLNVWEYVKVN